jgi:MarR family transcriptional regulator, organic hydroperoxide resistance regulator
LRLQPYPAPLGLLAALVHRATRQLVSAQVEPLGLSTPQFWALVAIAERTCSSQSELAARMHVDDATACRVVRSLTDAAWITAVRDGADRRRIQLAISPEGDALVQQVLPVARGLRAAVDAALSPEERAVTRTALTKILARLTALAEERAPLSPPVLARPARPALRRRGEPARRRAAQHR